MLANPMYASDGLKLNGGVDQWLTQEYMIRDDKIQACGVSLGMKQKALDCWIRLEFFDAIPVVEAAESDLVLTKSATQDIEELSVLREDDRFRPGVVLAQPVKVPTYSVHFCPEIRTIEVDILYLIEGGAADI